MIEVRPYFTNLLLFSVLFLITHSALSQIDNYWSWNFNTPSTLLAGAVTGGSEGPQCCLLCVASAKWELYRL